MSAFRVPRRPAASLLTAAVLFLLPIAVRLVPGPRTVDDAYITFRYARNILNGSGFVYNPGEHVLGTTTPLYTGLMALLALPAGGPRRLFPCWPWASTPWQMPLPACCCGTWDAGCLLRAWACRGVAVGGGAFQRYFCHRGIGNQPVRCLLTGAAWAHMTGRRTLAAAAPHWLTDPSGCLAAGRFAGPRPGLPGLAPAGTSCAWQNWPRLACRWQPGASLPRSITAARSRIL